MNNTVTPANMHPVIYNPFKTGHCIVVPKGSTYSPLDWYQRMEGVTENDMEVEITDVKRSDIPFATVSEPVCLFFIDENEEERSLLLTLGLVQANKHLLSDFVLAAG